MKIYELYGRREDRVPECTPYAFYRVALAQFEFRLLCGKPSNLNTLETGEFGLFYRPRMDIEERDIVKMMRINFSPFVNLISAIGTFEYNGDVYHTLCPTDLTLGILYSNLRHVVDTMSNPLTPQPIGQAFYDACPLPFPVWNQPARIGIRRRADGQPPVDPGFPLLLNAGDYFPAGYAIEDFERDVHRVRNFISFATRKECKLVSEGAAIDFDAPGHHRVLVSNDAVGLKNPDRIGEHDWSREALPEGDLSSFWSRVRLPPADMFMGVLNLAGERRADAGNAFALRSPLIAKSQCKHRWVTLMDNG